MKKKYEYIPILIARIMRMRKDDANKVTCNISLNNSDPALLALTIAAKPPPPFRELFQEKRSRFKESNAAGSFKSETVDL